jgi:hypothetical protein
MPKFSTKDLMIATALIAFGFGLGLFGYKETWWTGSQGFNPNWMPLRLILVVVGSGTIGVGGIYPFKTNGCLVATAFVIAVIFVVFIGGIATGGCGQ